MNWIHISQAINDATSLFVVIRVLILRLKGVYIFFCLFIVLQLLGSVVAFVEELTSVPHPDYRLTWIVLQVLLWAISLATVYSLLRGVLRTLPGLLKLSQRVLNATFLVAIVIGLWSARAELLAPSKASTFVAPISRAVAVTFVLNRAVCSSALLILLVILSFVLWFPVQVPKNLAVFCIGFAVYFAATTISLLAWSFWPSASVNLVDNLTMAVLSICYAYWAIFISAEGETVPVRIGHSWHVAEQERMIGQLEAMNSNLLRAARR